MLSFEERLFDYVFKDVPMSQIYVKKWNDNEFCDVCIFNSIGVPDDLNLFAQDVDNGFLTGDSIVGLKFDKSWKYDSFNPQKLCKHNQQELCKCIWLNSFYDVAKVKKAIGNRIFELIELNLKVNGSKWIEIWQHSFARDKPLFRCMTIDQLRIDMDLWNGHNN